MHWNAKITDFGLVKTILRATPRTGPHHLDLVAGEEGNFADAYELTGGTGSYKYMAPEVFLNELANEKVDQFSLGIILWELQQRMPLRHGRTRLVRGGQRVDYSPRAWAQDSARGMRAEIPPAWPPALKTLITSLWAQNKDSRPSCKEIMAREAAPPGGHDRRRRRLTLPGPRAGRAQDTLAPMQQREKCTDPLRTPSMVRLEMDGGGSRRGRAGAVGGGDGGCQCVVQ